MLTLYLLKFLVLGHGLLEKSCLALLGLEQMTWVFGTRVSHGLRDSASA